MSEPHLVEIVLKGRAGAQTLRPLLDDFTLSHTPDGNTHLVGTARDASHLHGVVAHLTSMNTELVSIVPIEVAPSNLTNPNTNPEWNTPS
jgi:hypothetical protein